MDVKKLTKVEFKNIGVPKTVKEKYDKLEAINPELKKLVEVFDLELKL